MVLLRGVDDRKSGNVSERGQIMQERKESSGK
jgi:hypothetical protein